jgi:hypothetical protein
VSLHVNNLQQSSRAPTQAHLVLADVLAAVAPGCVSPFFPLLLVHTSSAMTNMDPSIRKDSLKVRVHEIIPTYVPFFFFFFFCSKLYRFCAFHTHAADLFLRCAERRFALLFT